jgi:hypothetical protein
MMMMMNIKLILIMVMIMYKSFLKYLQECIDANGPHICGLYQAGWHESQWENRNYTPS